MADTTETGTELEAAKKTVDVLKKKVRALQSGAEKSTIQRQLEAAHRRDETSRRKRDLMEMRTQELKRYSETLELEIEARTHAMKTIADNVAFGFLLVRRDLSVEPGFTKSCARLFGVMVEAGMQVGALFGPAADRGRQSFELGVEQIFEDILPEDILVDQLPRRFPLPSGRVLAAEARVIRSKTGEVSSILLTVSDTTEFEAARRESQKNRTLVDVLRQKAAFARFIGDTARDLQDAREAFRRGAMVVVRRAVHTMKGNAASYGLDDQVALLHAIEERSAVDQPALDEIEASFRGFLTENRHVLELDYDDVEREAFELTSGDVEKLRTLSRHENPDGAALRRWTASVLRRPASLIIGPMGELAEKLAHRLGKTMDFLFEGGEICVDPDTVGPVLRNVVHLVRNAVDHAIEPSNERGGKAARGLVRLSIRETETEYAIRVEDDGRGIALEALAAQAVARGLRNAEQVAAMTDDDKRQLVFLESVSTAQETTDISGRGLGLSAVQSAVRGAGGSIDVESETGRGTTFVLHVPKPQPLLSVAPPPREGSLVAPSDA